MVEAVLRCPRCHAAMMSCRRDDVAFDQCAGCRGVFLGALELARLIESAGAAAAAPPPANGHHKQVYAGRHRRD